MENWDEYPWCRTHHRPYELCEGNLYKVTVSGDTAENAVDNLFPDDIYFRQTRVSPIVVYLQLTDRDAVEMAQRPDFTVVRASENWSI